MIISMKGLNEENSVKRVMEDIHDEPFVDRIIVIDGGSTDYTVNELHRWPKVQVYRHEWLDWYHDMEVLQSNIAMSYVPHGELCFILDFDERMSGDLKNLLTLFNKDMSQIPIGHTCAFSRRTFDVLRYPDSPYAMIGVDGWPMISHQIGQYPDYQCRLYRRAPYLHWVNSPHHLMLGVIEEQTQNADILHYEKDDARQRTMIEKKWLRAQVRRRELGLTADVFECNVKPELGQYNNSVYWNNPKG